MKMYKLVIIALFSAIGLKASSIVVTSDITSNTTWDADTVLIEKNTSVVIVNGVRLTIMPGTRVRWQKGSPYLTVKGAITAIGKENDSIYFSHGKTIKPLWQGIRLLNRNKGYKGYDSSYIKFCVLENTICSDIDSMYMIRGGAVYCGAGNYVEISNSKLNKNEGYHGGAVYVDSGAVVHIDNCFLGNNTADFYGGGAIMTNDNGKKKLLVQNCRFERNYARTGGAIRIGKGTEADFNNCVFYKDTTDSINPFFNDLKGGALAIFGPADVTLRNCLIFFCRSYGEGGGIYSSDASINLFNCTIANNSSVYGGGVYLARDSVASSPLFVNTIDGGNGTLSSLPRDSAGCGIYLDSSVTPIFRYCHLYDTVYDYKIMPYTGEFSNSRYYNTGFVNSNPPFLPDTVVEGYQLFSFLGKDDPAINGGTPDTTGLGLPELDLAGNKRVNGSAIDIGALEYQGFTSIAKQSFQAVKEKLYGSGIFEMEIYSLNGKKLEMFRTNISFHSVQKYLESNYSRGAYIVSMNREGKQISSKKIFVK